MSGIIIAVIVFAAFARAAQEYGKNAFAWGAIGLAAFFVPQYLIGFLGALVLGAAGYFRALTLFSIGSFVASAAIAAWAYNNLMNRAIEELAARDAAEAAATPPPLDPGRMR